MLLQYHMLSPASPRAIPALFGKFRIVCPYSTTHITLNNNGNPSNPGNVNPKMSNSNASNLSNPNVSNVNANNVSNPNVSGGGSGGDRKVLDANFENEEFSESARRVHPKFTQTGSFGGLWLGNRPLPVSPSFFTGVQNSAFHDFLYILQSRIEQIKQRMQLTGEAEFYLAPTKYPTWVLKEDLEKKLDCKLRTTQYRAIAGKLNEIYALTYQSQTPFNFVSNQNNNNYHQQQEQQQQPLLAEGRSRNKEDIGVKYKVWEDHETPEQFLAKYRRSIVVKEEVKKERKVDAWGRMSAVGRRKDAVAKVYVVPGMGEFLVNGVELYKYFPQFNQREESIKPLMITNTLDKWNVWAKTHGGGPTGQSGAIRLGLSRVLEFLDSAYRPALKDEGLLSRDPRTVEPKKPGRKKARKLKQWVKR